MKLIGMAVANSIGSDVRIRTSYTPQIPANEIAGVAGVFFLGMPLRVEFDDFSDLDEFHEALCLTLRGNT